MHIARNNARVAGATCAVGAVGLGIAYMLLAGAPARLLMVNGAALILGLLLWAAVDQLPERARHGIATIGVGLALVATALFGISADGATRWASLGPILLQPSLILLPMLIVALPRAPASFSLIGIALSSFALALQPDRGTAGALAVCAAVFFLLRRDRWTLAAATMTLAGFATTLSRSDNLPAVPFVDGVLYSAFDVHLLAGLAVAVGAMLLPLPALLAWRGREGAEFPLLFAATWIALIAAAALGNYPTPLVGYGGSAVVGYLLSLSMLPKGLSRAEAPAAKPRGEAGEEESGTTLAVALR
jgi:cell division protein FtsW (lipid II flippase)